MQVALGRSPEEEYRDNLCKLGEQLGGNCSLFFTNRPKEEILAFFNEFKSLDYARAGFKATEAFVIPKGEMPFAHSMFEEFKKLRLPVEMKNGIICMREDYTVCKKGKVLTPEQCRILVCVWSWVECRNCTPSPWHTSLFILVLFGARVKLRYFKCCLVFCLWTNNSQMVFINTS